MNDITPEELVALMGEWNEVPAFRITEDSLDEGEHEIWSFACGSYGAAGMVFRFHVEDEVVMFIIKTDDLLRAFLKMALDSE